MAAKNRPGNEPGSAIPAAQILYGPPLPPAAPAPKRAWGQGYIFEEGIGRRDYVVVEEVVDDYVGLVISPWPRVHKGGGLQFPPEEERREVLVDRVSFQRRLADREVVAYDTSFVAQEPLQSRPLAPGDVFAIDTSLAGDRVDFRKLGARWIKGTIFDVTAMARDAAKAAMLAALAGEPLAEEEVAAIAEPPPSPQEDR